MLAAACGGPDAIAPGAPGALPEHHAVVLDQSPKQRRQMIPAEVILRAYLSWFGGLAPGEVVQRAHGANLFDAWSYYLAALGLPDHHVDAPRVSQSNTVMLAALGFMELSLGNPTAAAARRPKTVERISELPPG